MNAAITGVGGGVGQAVIHALRRSSLDLHLVGLDADPWSAGLYQCDERAIIPVASPEEAFVGELERVITSHRVEALIPGTDCELVPLAQARDRFEALGCTTIVSSPDIIRIARDKMATAETLSRAGIPFARTMPAQAFARACTAGSFPAIAKPRDGSGSVGARVLFCEDDLTAAALHPRDVVQEYLVPVSWGLSELRLSDVLRGGRMRQQDELSVQGMVAPDGTVVGVFVSINELRDGVVTKVCPSADPDLVDLAWDTFAVLSRLGHVGPCNVEGRVTHDGPVFYEINPRFTGVTAARAEMGFNECEAGLRLFVQKESPASVAPDLAWQAGPISLRYFTEQLVPREAIEEMGAWH